MPEGTTVDTAHVVVTSTNTRENLYVSMTRGRESNTAYVALDQPDDSHAAPQQGEATSQTVLIGVLRHTGTELSAHQTIDAEQDGWSSIAQIAAEYETIAAVAQRERWIATLVASGLSQEQVDNLAGSDSFGPLTAEFRRVEADNYNIDGMLPDLVQARSLIDADDIGAVLVSRLRHATARPRRGRQRNEPELIAGLIPVAAGPMSAEMGVALAERLTSIATRAQQLAEAAIADKESWVERCGTMPADPSTRAEWTEAVTTVAAYRDRYTISSRSALGDLPRSDAQKLDAARADRAVRRAQAISREVNAHVGCRPATHERRLMG